LRFVRFTQILERVIQIHTFQLWILHSRCLIFKVPKISLRELSKYATAYLRLLICELCKYADAYLLLSSASPLSFRFSVPAKSDYITFTLPCQEVFSGFFWVFAALKPSLNRTPSTFQLAVRLEFRCLKARISTALSYNTITSAVCQHLF